MRLRRGTPVRPIPGHTTRGRAEPAKNAGSGRHRSPAGEQQGADLTTDHELDAYLAAIAPTRDREVTDPGRTFGSARVYQLRLPPGAEERIQWLAQQHGTSALTLLQSWVLQRLHHEFSPPGHRPCG